MISAIAGRHWGRLFSLALLASVAGGAAAGVAGQAPDHGSAPALVSPKITDRAGFEKGLVSDFESGDLSVGFGHGWSASSDERIGGSSTAELDVVYGGADGSTHSLAVVGTILEESDETWAGALFSPGPSPMVPVDMSSKDYISFWSRGTERIYVVLLSFEDQGLEPLFMTFAGGPEWVHHLFPLEEFGGIPGRGIAGVFFGSVGVPGTFRLQIDDVEFKGAPSPAEFPRAPIVVDGEFSDWDHVAPVYRSPADAAAGRRTGIERVWVSSNPERLFLRVRLAGGAPVPSDSDLVLYVDADDRAETGLVLDDIGAGFRWSLTEQKCFSLGEEANTPVAATELAIQQSPRTPAPEYELSMRRGATLNGAQVFPNSTIAISLRVESPETPAAINSTGRLEIHLSGGGSPTLPDTERNRR